MSGIGRQSLSMGVACLDLALAFAGESLVFAAFFLKFVLESRVAVVIGNHGGALAYFLVAVGCILCFVSMAAAKVRVVVVVVVVVVIIIVIHFIVVFVWFFRGGEEVGWGWGRRPQC